MSNLDFEEFQRTNGYGSANKNISDKQLNEKIHSNNKEQRKKNKIFTMGDMERKSEHYIETHFYDIGRGMFIYSNNLEKKQVQSKG